MESMRKLRLRNPPLLAILINGVLLSRTLAWDPDMPGGMKLVIDGDTFSFTTDTCSGGVFFKRPVFIQLTCFHGYYLTRPNGCSMENNQIIGGQNYVCQEVNKDKTKKIQAFIPVTNPDNPLAHTISFFDEPGMLKNLRRLAYVEGLEGAYDNLNLLSAPIGAIVTTPDKTPRVTIARTCYQGKSQRSASAYLVSLPGGQQDAPRNKMFTLGCADGAVDFPWNTESVHNFTEGYSAPTMFEKEQVAKLLDESELSSQASLSAQHEIWGGLAYCLKTKQEKILDSDVKTVMSGLEPSIESLALFCPKRRVISDLRRKRSTAPLRRKRDIETSVEFNILMTCVATCWKQNPDKCHRKIPEVNHMPFCPPYCGGKKHRPGPALRAFWGIYEKKGIPPVPPVPLTEIGNPGIENALENTAGVVETVIDESFSGGHGGEGDPIIEENIPEAVIPVDRGTVDRTIGESIHEKVNEETIASADKHAAQQITDARGSPLIEPDTGVRPLGSNMELLIGQSVPKLSSYLQSLISRFSRGGSRSRRSGLRNSYFQPEEAQLRLRRRIVNVPVELEYDPNMDY